VRGRRARRARQEGGGCRARRELRLDGAHGPPGRQGRSTACAERCAALALQAKVQPAPVWRTGRNRVLLMQ
jgi:hypothetical protein